MAKITGLGGVFLKIDTDTQKLYSWYEEVLELDVTDYGLNFLKPSVLTLVTFDAEATEAILNFSVDDLDGFIKKLSLKGVELYKEVETFSYGKFAQIKDLAGNVIELWEPFVDKYVDVVQKEVQEYKENVKTIHKKDEEV